MADYSYIGAGKVYLKEYGASAGLIEVGNCSALNFSITEETKELKDYTQGGGGTYNEVRRISAVEMTATMHDLSPENLARVLYGTTTDVNEASVSNEAHACYQGTFIPFDYIPTAADPTVTNVAGTTTYVKDTDYNVRPGGIYVITGGAMPNDGTSVHIDYTKAGQDVVQALLNSGKEWELFFDGLNEARSGKSTRIHVWRQKIGATQNLNVIGDEFAALEVAGKVLKDTSKNGTSVSQYFKVDIEQ